MQQGDISTNMTDALNMLSGMDIKGLDCYALYYLLLCTNMQ